MRKYVLISCMKMGRNTMAIETMDIMNLMKIIIYMTISIQQKKILIIHHIFMIWNLYQPRNHLNPLYFNKNKPGIKPYILYHHLAVRSNKTLLPQSTLEYSFNFQRLIHKCKWYWVKDQIGTIQPTTTFENLYTKPGTDRFELIIIS